MASFFESLFAALFKYRPAVFEKGELAFGAPASVWLVLVAGLLIGVPAVLTYARAAGKGGRRDRVILGALRASSPRASSSASSGFPRRRSASSASPTCRLAARRRASPRRSRTRARTSRPS